MIEKYMKRASILWYVLLGFLMMSACMQDQRLAWQDTSQNENGFRIYRLVGQEKRLVGEVGANVTHFIDRRAPSGACYIVTAFNDEGESPPTGVVCGKYP